MNRLLLTILTLAPLAACSDGVSESASAEPVALVKTATAALGEPAETLIVYGAATAGPASELALSAPVESIIATIHAPPGTLVKVGQAIVTLRPSPNAALDFGKSANDSLQTEAAYARARRLRSDGLMSDGDVESARSLAASAAATRASLGRRVASLTLRAAFSGTVQMIGGSPGDVLAAGAPAARVAATGQVRARFGIDPALARRIVPGASIIVSPATASSGFAVTVTSVDPVADPQTRLASLYANIMPQSNIASGETLRGLVTIGHRSGVVTVPYGALLDDGGETYVFVVSNSIAHRKTVTTGAADKGVIEIQSGLKAGEEIVVSGGTALEDGIKVRVAK